MPSADASYNEPERTPIFGAGQNHRQIGYAQGAEVFDMAGRRRCRYNEKSGVLYDLNSAKILGYVSLTRKFVGLSWVAAELFLSTDETPPIPAASADRAAARSPVDASHDAMAASPTGALPEPPLKERQQSFAASSLTGKNEPRPLPSAAPTPVVREQFVRLEAVVVPAPVRSFAAAARVESIPAAAAAHDDRPSAADAGVRSFAAERPAAPIAAPYVEQTSKAWETSIPHPVSSRSDEDLQRALATVRQLEEALAIKPPRT